MGVQLGDLRPFLDKLIAELKAVRRNTEIAGCCTAQTSAGSNTSVPAGFRSVAIAVVTPGVDVIMTDGSIYQMTTAGETLVQVADGSKSLPAYEISGGMWKWVGIK